MDTTLYPTDADLLHALVPLVPAATLQATLDELGLGSVPHNRLLEDALVSIVQAVPALRTRLLGQVHLTLDQAAAMLRITPSTLKQLVQTEIIPVSSSGNAAPQRQVIIAAELLKRRSHIQQHLAELSEAHHSRGRRALSPGCAMRRLPRRSCRGLVRRRVCRSSPIHFNRRR